jgi:hypothetical protein
VARAGSQLGIAGALMMQGANGNLSNAIEYYNADLVRQLEARTTPSRRAAMLRVHGVF